MANIVKIWVLALFAFGSGDFGQHIWHVLTGDGRHQEQEVFIPASSLTHSGSILTASPSGWKKEATLAGMAGDDLS